MRPPRWQTLWCATSMSLPLVQPKASTLKTYIFITLMFFILYQQLESLYFKSPCRQESLAVEPCGFCSTTQHFHLKSARAFTWEVVCRQLHSLHIYLSRGSE